MEGNHKGRPKRQKQWSKNKSRRPTTKLLRIKNQVAPAQQDQSIDPPPTKVDMIVVIDGSRILGLGDLECRIDKHVQREIMKPPNIIRFKEVFLTPTRVATVMEYATRGSFLIGFVMLEGLVKMRFEARLEDVFSRDHYNMLDAALSDTVSRLKTAIPFSKLHIIIPGCDPGNADEPVEIEIQVLQ